MCDNIPIMTGLFIKNSLPWHLRLRSALPGTIILACACAILLLTAPTNGDFWWFEAPGHAMNGVFIRDFVAAMPWRDPVGFAIDYYMRYPAVTILFYPPLFPIVEAFFFALFGVSHFVAQLTVTVFLFAFALGTRQLARLWMPDAAAVGVALTALGLPLVTFWGRQVMLEMPAYAFLIWSMYYLSALSARRADLADCSRGCPAGGRTIREADHCLRRLRIRDHAGVAIRAVGIRPAASMDRRGNGSGAARAIGRSDIAVRLDGVGFRDRRCGLARTDLVQPRILCRPAAGSGRHRRSRALPCSS